MARIKDKKITILTSTGEQNELGEWIQTWFPLPGAENIWAYYRQASSKEIYQAATINTKVEAIFEINWRDDLSTYMRIQYRGKEYSITGIDDFEGYKETLKITAIKYNW